MSLVFESLAKAGNAARRRQLSRYSLSASKRRNRLSLRVPFILVLYVRPFLGKTDGSRI